ncbi:MAG: S8 family serine peptidase [Limisphaerales bacterium]
MKHTRLIASLLLAAASLPPATKVFIVTLRGDVDVDGLVNEIGLAPCHRYRHALNGFAAELDAASTAGLRKDARVLAVEADGEIIPCAQTVPTGVLRMGITNFPVAHINGQDNRINVNVAVMDTGIQTNHPDLNVVQAVDCTGSGLNGDDWNGHGTHVAGIIGALDNDFGVVGVAPGARLWSVQVMSPTNSHWTAFIAGCDYIAANSDRIEIANASLAGALDGTAPYSAIRQAVSNVVSRGIVFVAAAGNFRNTVEGSDEVYGTDDDVLPAALSEVMAVSAMDPTNDTMAVFTDMSIVPKPCPVVSPGMGIDLAAPGVNTLSTWKDGTYAMDSGTSMACAHASGLVALYIAANGRAHSLEDVYAIRQALINSGQPQSAWNPGWNHYGGDCYCVGDIDGNPEPLAFPSEAWVPTPVILSGSMTAQGFQLSFPAVPGYTYTVLEANSLSPSTAWTPITSTNGNGSVATVAVTDPAPDFARFYRLLRTPTS